MEFGEIDPRRRRWAFAVVASGFATVAGIGTALAFHQVAVLGERGLSAAEAATNFLPQSIAAANGASEGALLDRWTGTRSLGRLRGRLMTIIVPPLR